MLRALSHGPRWGLAGFSVDLSIMLGFKLSRKAAPSAYGIFLALVSFDWLRSWRLAYKVYNTGLVAPMHPKFNMADAKTVRTSLIVAAWLTDST